MTQFRHDEPRHREPDGVFRSRQDEDRRAPRDAGSGTTEHRRRADLGVAKHPEQFAEAVETLLKQPVDCFKCAVARRDARATRGDDRLHTRIGQAMFHRRRHLVRFVPDDPPLRHDVPGVFEERPDRVATRVGVGGACVADRQNEAAHTRRRRAPVFRDAVDICCHRPAVSRVSQSRICPLRWMGLSEPVV